MAPVPEVEANAPVDPVLAAEEAEEKERSFPVFVEDVVVDVVVAVDLAADDVPVAPVPVVEKS